MRFKREMVCLSLFSVALLFGLHTFNSKPILVLDMRRAIELPAAHLAHSTLSASQQQKLMARYTALLPHVIQTYAKTHRALIVSAQVLAGKNDSDITDVLVKETLRRIQHEP